MRNLKRALSMALASVMLLGMMVVGTSAASYPDVDANDNVEAIAFLQAAGVMIGDDKGNFNPDKNVTRNDMAVIMSILMDLDVADYAGAAPFTDVPTWAEAYVSACYAEGIVSGTSATTYSGDNGVKAVDAGLMVMKALKYFQYKGDFGTDYTIEVVKQASKIDLYDGIKAKANDVLTRNEVAQLVMNGLEAFIADNIETGDNASISIGDVVITSNSKGQYWETDETLMKSLFEDRFVKDEEATDDLGMPGYAWLDTEKDKDEQEIVFVADKASKVLVSEKNTTAKELYIDKVDEDYASDCPAKSVEAGDEVYFFLKDKKIVDVVVLDYELYKVKEIKTSGLSNKDKEDGVTAKVALVGVSDGASDVTVKDTEFAGFDYAKNDYILAVVNNEKKVLASELAETVEGKVDAKNKDGEVRIDGTYYGVAMADAEAKGKGTWYLNKAEQVMFWVEADEDEASDDYAIIYNIVEGYDETKHEDGYTEESEFYYAYIVLTDGSKAKYVINEKESVWYPSAEGDCFKVVTYSFEDGELVIESVLSEKTATKALDKDNAVIADKKYATSTTVFVFAAKETKDDETKMTVSVVKGVKNVDLAAGEYVIVFDEDNKYAEYVFVNDTKAEEEEDPDTLYGVISEAGTLGYVLEDHDDDEDTSKIKVDSFVVDGLENPLKAYGENATKLDALKAGAVFSYELKDGYAVEVTAITAELTIDNIDEDYVYMTNGDKYVYEDVEVTSVTIDEYKDGEIVVTVSDGELEAKDVIKVVTKVKDGDNILVKAYKVTENPYEGLI